MWRFVIPIKSQTLSDFENHFDFRFNETLRGFILDHNGGSPEAGVFHTTVRVRRIGRLLDFSDKSTPDGAWSFNERLRDKLTDKRIIIGIDAKNNFVCVERHYKHQKIVVWSHVSGEFEDCLLDIPAFLRAID